VWVPRTAEAKKRRFDLVEDATGSVVKKSEVLEKIYSAAPWKIRRKTDRDPNPTLF
jgi:hypothetical protein